MSLQMHSYVVGIAGFLYGSVGYGLSILTCILGATLRHFSVELPAPKIPIKSRGSRIIRVPVHESKARQSQNRSKGRPLRPSALGVSKLNSDSTPSETVAHRTPTSDKAQLRRVASLDSFDRRSSFVLVAPVITINHVDRVDNMSIKAPTITIHPSFGSQTEKKPNPKRRSLTMGQQPLPDLSPPRSPLPREGPRPGPVFRLSSLKPLWGASDKPNIHRSASSPHLAEFVEREVAVLELKRDGCKEKPQSITLSSKGSKKTLRQKKSADFATYHSSPSKFFSAFPKNIEKKRSQTLRTQPYNAPYYVPPPVPPIPADHARREKEAKRAKTLPSEKIQRPSTAPQMVLFQAEKT